MLHRPADFAFVPSAATSPTIQIDCLAMFGNRDEKTLEAGISTDTSASEETSLPQHVYPHGWRLVVTTLGYFTPSSLLL